MIDWSKVSILTVLLSIAFSVCSAHSIEEISHQYVDFIIKYGSHEKTLGLDDLQTLFAPNFKVSINGNTFLETHESYLEKMAAVRDWTDSWQIQIHQIVLSSEGDGSVISYECATKEGLYATVAILEFDDDMLIKQVKTIYAKIENRPNWYIIPQQNG